MAKYKIYVAVLENIQSLQRQQHMYREKCTAVAYYIAMIWYCNVCIVPLNKLNTIIKHEIHTDLTDFMTESWKTICKIPNCEFVIVLFNKVSWSTHLCFHLFQCWWRSSAVQQLMNLLRNPLTCHVYQHNNTNLPRGALQSVQCTACFDPPPPQNTLFC